MPRARILIVEPEVAIAQLLAEMLCEEGYAVEIARSPHNALHMVATGGPDAFHVVLSVPFTQHPREPYVWLDRLRSRTRAAIIICTRLPVVLYADYHERGYAAVLEEPFDVQEALDLVARLAPP